MSILYEFIMAKNTERQYIAASLRLTTFFYMFMVQFTYNIQ